MSLNPAAPDLLERLDRILQLERARVGDMDAVIEFHLYLSLLDGPERSGAVAELRRGSRARTFGELVAFIRTSGLSEAEVNALGDDLERRVLSFDKADLTKVLRAAWPTGTIREPRAETEDDPAGHRARLPGGYGSARSVTEATLLAVGARNDLGGARNERRQ